MTMQNIQQIVVPHCADAGAELDAVCRADIRAVVRAEVLQKKAPNWQLKGFFQQAKRRKIASAETVL